MKYRLTGFSRSLILLIIIAPYVHLFIDAIKREPLPTTHLAAKITEEKDTISQNAVFSEEGLIKMYVHTEGGPLNLRSSPGVEGSIITQIPHAARLSLIAYDDKLHTVDGKPGKWCEVYYAGYRGWCWGNYLIEKN